MVTPTAKVKPTSTLQDVVASLRSCAWRVARSIETLKVIDGEHVDALAALASAWDSWDPPVKSFVNTAIDDTRVRAETIAEQVDQLLASAMDALEASVPLGADAAALAPAIAPAFAPAVVPPPARVCQVSAAALAHVEDALNRHEAEVGRLRPAAACVEQRLKAGLVVPSNDGPDTDILLTLYEDAHTTQHVDTLMMCVVHPHLRRALQGDARVVGNVWWLLQTAKTVSREFASAVLEHRMDMGWLDVSRSTWRSAFPEPLHRDNACNDLFDALMTLPLWRFKAMDANARDSNCHTVLQALVCRVPVLARPSEVACIARRVRALLAWPAMAALDVNVVDTHGWTALAHAVSFPLALFVSAMLESPFAARFDVNARTAAGADTPLLSAVRFRNEDAVQALLRHRVRLLEWRTLGHSVQDLDVNALDKDGFTALELALERENVHALKLLTAPAHAACYTWPSLRGVGVDDVVTRLCVKVHSVDPNPLIQAACNQGGGSTDPSRLLRVALGCDHEWMARFALRGMCDADTMGPFAARGAFTALFQGSLRVFKVCLETAFDVNSFWAYDKDKGLTAVDTSKRSAETLLMGAVRRDATDFVHALLELPASRGLNVHLRNFQGRSALDMVELGGRTDAYLRARDVSVGACAVGRDACAVGRGACAVGRGAGAVGRGAGAVGRGAGAVGTCCVVS